MTRLHLLLGAGLLAASASVFAQSATNGKMLYTTVQVTGKQSCSSSACHGTLPNNALNRIANGTSASNIKGALASTSQMTFLNGKLSDAQINDLTAYIAGQLGRTPSYLPTTPVPSPALSPTSLTFTSQALNSTSAAQTVSVSNAVGAGAALVISSLTLTSGSDFKVSGGTCAVGTSVAAGSACSVTLTFTPTLAGARSATLSVGHNGSTGSSTVSLSGTGVDSSPSVTLSPTTLSFAQTVGASSAPLRVTVGNSGTAALSISSVAVSGAQASEFAIGSASTCKAGASVAAGSNCFVELSFTPAATGARAATLAIAHNASSTASMVSLTGQGNSSAQPGLALDTLALDLGAQGLATAGAPRTATVTNNGQADLKISKVSATGTNAADIVLGGTCTAGATVAPAATCTVTVALKPSALGPRAASVEIASNAPGGTASLSVGGVGIASAAPELTLSQPSIGFGTVSMGTTSIARSVTLTNTGSAPLVISSIQSSSTEFKATHDCAASLAPGAGCKLSVTYSPVSDNASESVVITSNAFSSPNSVVLTGLGSTATLPVLVWSGGTNKLEFAATEVGKTLAGTPLTLVNNGPGSVTVSSIGTSGAQADAFSVGGGTCLGGTSLAASASCTVIVSFVPDIAGVRTAVLMVASSGSNPPDVALSGSGVAGSTGGGGGTTPPDTGGGGGTTPPGTGGGGGTTPPGTGGGGGTTPPDTGGGGTTPATGTLAASPAILDYRSLKVRTGDRSDPLTVRISNSSAAAATIASVTTSAGFVVDSGSAADRCPGVPWTLAAGASCTVTVVFAPGTGGAMTGTLKVTSATGQTSQVQLSAQAETVSTNEGAGALDARWLALLVLAIALLQRQQRLPLFSLSKESST